MSLDGKQISELARVTSVRDDSLLVVDNGGTESNSVYVSDLLKKAGNDKQDKLTAGDNIVINNNVISAPTINARNIGEIVPSVLPLTDAGLHLLDGSLIDGNGIYGEFVDYIAGLVSSYPNLFISETDWQASISSYGVCGKFVYNTELNTVRLPKISGFVEGTHSINTLGDLVEAGLPNITGGFRGTGQNSSSSDSYERGVFKAIANGTGYSGASGNDVKTWDFDASRSSSIYGNSDTVQPQSIKVLLYVVVANSSRKEIDVNTEKNIVDNNLKADKDFSNVVLPNQNFIQKSISWGMPDYSRGIQLTGSDSFTCPSAGFVTIHGSGGNSGRAYVNGNLVGSFSNSSADSSANFFVSKNDVITLRSGYTFGTDSYFYPLKGVY